MNRHIRKLLQQFRFKIVDWGFDLRPLDTKCWEDQAALFEGRPANVIIDAGASVGTVARTYRELFPNAKVICFEPISESIEILRSQFAHDDKISSHVCALGAENGIQELFINTSRETSSLLASDQSNLNDSYLPILRPIERRQVKVCSLDSFCKNEQIERIDLLKMDVQGGELDILQGAKQLLAQQKIAVIYSEVFFVPMYQNQPLFGEMCAELAAHRYSFHYAYNFVFNGRSGRLFSADALFVSPNLLDRSKTMLSGYNRR
jgi:FkbM family methyltransferase